MNTEEYLLMDYQSISAGAELNPPAEEQSEPNNSVMDSQDYYPPSNQQAFEFESTDTGSHEGRTGSAGDPSAAEANGGHTFSIRQQPRNQTLAISKDALSDLLDEKLDRFATKTDIEMAVQQVRSNTSSILENRREIAAIRSDIAELKKANSTTKLRQAVLEAMSGQQGGLLSTARFTHSRNNIPPPLCRQSKVC